VLQLLHIDGPVPAKLLEEWVLPDGLSKHKVAIDRLVQLRVFDEALDRYLRSILSSNFSFFVSFMNIKSTQFMPLKWFKLIYFVSNVSLN